MKNKLLLLLEFLTRAHRQLLSSSLMLTRFNVRVHPCALCVCSLVSAVRCVMCHVLCVICGQGKGKRESEKIRKSNPSPLLSVEEEEKMFKEATDRFSPTIFPSHGNPPLYPCAILSLCHGPSTIHYPLSMQHPLSAIQHPLAATSP